MKSRWLPFISPTDAPVHLRALLFIPAKREPGILAARKEPGVMLYSHNVLIQEYCTDLLPDWLNFVDGGGGFGRPAPECEPGNGAK
ncbi:MAG: hypothetical protein M5U34_17640 [Chloroflexi bacterium]|nr:hypothetical protein [Chloroflexota bacterium]